MGHGSAGAGAGCPLLGAAGSNGSNGRAAVQLHEAGGACGAAEGTAGGLEILRWASLSPGHETIKMGSKALFCRHRLFFFFFFCPNVFQFPVN